MHVFLSRFKSLDAFSKAEDPDVMTLKTTSGAVGKPRCLACPVSGICLHRRAGASRSCTGMGTGTRCPQRGTVGAAW